MSPTTTAASRRRPSAIGVLGLERVGPARPARAAGPACVGEGLAHLALFEVRPLLGPRRCGVQLGTGRVQLVPELAFAGGPARALHLERRDASCQMGTLLHPPRS